MSILSVLKKSPARCKTGFFDQFDRFYTTSKTSPYPERLNCRFEAIVAKNKELYSGKRVLDIASHDGRWSFAALSAGASHVLGIEPREELVENARATLAYYNVEESRYSFERGDVFNFIQGRQFDVVLCLGFYYHTIRHAELLDLIERTGAKFVVIDTEVTPSIQQGPVTATGDPRLVHQNPYEIQVLRDPVDDEQMAWSDSMTRNGYTIVGRPSRAAIAFLADHFGFSCEQFDWKTYLAHRGTPGPSMTDYAEGWRDTFFLSRR
jgi:protein-L-isoaspartate O-methyltransferase